MIGFDSGGFGGGAVSRPPEQGGAPARGALPLSGPSSPTGAWAWIEIVTVMLDPVFMEVWQTAADGRTCPECAPYAGGVWERGFGPMPPLHPNCRCQRGLHHIAWRTRPVSSWSLRWVAG